MSEPWARRTRATCSCGPWICHEAPRDVVFECGITRSSYGRPRSGFWPQRGRSASCPRRISWTSARSPQTCEQATSAAFAQRPDKPWCEGASACIESRYDLEGKLPLGVRLANKLEEGSAKKIAEFVSFQSELRLLDPAQAAPLTALTKIETPPAGGLEQTIFWVNQILRFGKFLAVLQPMPNDPTKTVVTAYMALAIKGDVLDRKAEYARVPVLKNLLPAQVLMGNSSFNTGNSISAGLPVYARNRIATFADALTKR